MTFAIDQSFFFIRHGQTDWNVEKRIQGKTDIPLNQIGRLQAEQAGRVFSNHAISMIISSDLSRASETAYIINQTVQAGIYHDARLQERDFGLVEGLSPAEQSQRPAHELFHDIIEENGFILPLEAETLPEFDLRVISTVASLLQTYRDETILLVSHGAVFSSLCRQLLKQDIRSENGAPYHFHYEDDKWQLSNINYSYIS